MANVYRKVKIRIISISQDYTYTEAKMLLGKMGFAEHNKGKTSGSRVKFYRGSDGDTIDAAVEKTVELYLDEKSNFVN